MIAIRRYLDLCVVLVRCGCNQIGDEVNVDGDDEDMMKSEVFVKGKK